jgi:hypothetical protein
MLRSLATFAATTMLATAAFAAAVGEAAPAFKGTDIITGKEISNESLKAKRWSWNGITWLPLCEEIL